MEPVGISNSNPKLTELSRETRPTQNNPVNFRCIDPEHEHEKIKLLVRKRPKKAKIRESGTENSNSRGESENESPTDCGSRSIGLQCDSNQVCFDGKLELYFVISVLRAAV